MSREDMYSDIVLPPQFYRDGSASVPELRSYVAACIDFLTSPMVSSILECHPNDVAVQGPDPKWDSWWKWAAAGGSKWTLLIPGWHPNITTVPKSLKEMLDTVDSFTLPRKTEFATHGNEPTLRGMSPKKSHEVLRMSNFIQQVLRESPTEIRHVVDVGAGQGYLSRALSTSPFSMNVLALDFSEAQTKGAERRTSNKKLKQPSSPNVGSNSSSPSISNQQEGSLVHETAHITPHTLRLTVSKWISDCCQTVESPIPVLFVALHACGSLTPDILRCFIENHSSPLVHSDSHVPRWYAAGMVVAGCCYNLMSPHSDFPLSEPTIREQKAGSAQLYLSYNHRSLAAQSPLQWSISSSAKVSAELAVRKVVYRALFNKLVDFNWPDTSSAALNDRLIKVGRLPAVAYSTFRNFVAEAERKTAYKISILTEDQGNFEEKYAALTSCLQVLHALRSRIGPVIESLIIVDRYLYLVENLPGRKIVARNLFEQDLGSARNIVLAVWP